MTPQLQQAIRLLQLSTLDLQAEVQELLETNPMLERSDGDEDWPGESRTEAAPANGELPEQADEDAGAGDALSEGAAETVSVAENSAVDIPSELPVDSNWDEIYDLPLTTSSSGGEFDPALFENQSGRTSESLREYLLWQMRLTPFSEVDLQIAEAIIDSVNDEGYLVSSVQSIWEGLTERFKEQGAELALEIDEVECVLHRIQSFDPPGVAARDLQECLSIQLRQVPENTRWLAEARTLIDKYIDLLGSRDYNQIMRRMKLSQDELREVIGLVQTLNPRPGSTVAQSEPEYIVPDVIVRKHQGRWRVELNPETVPRLRINAHYAKLVKRADNSSDNVFLKNNLQEARWFLKSLQSRNETLLKVARCIVERQRGFLEHGEEAMKALVLADVASEVGMHESTISRVTNQKYMHTPRGIYELKYFFSSHVSTASGGACSATAIRALIKKLIAAENPQKPLSDSKIASVLSEQGINVARRTVAKYREAMSLPPSNERKRLG